ncbi:MAG: proteobacterial dedicated sortase system histidine kinase [Pseudomonadota bacterium]
MTRTARRGLSLRTQVLLLSAVLLAIPWLGYQYVTEVEQFLRRGQEQAVAGTARAVATALHDRPRLFRPAGEGVPAEGGVAALLSAAPRLDGRAEDWLDQPVDVLSGSRGEARDAGGLTFYSLFFDFRAGRFGRHVYLLLRVSDDRVLRPPRAAEAARGDHVVLQAHALDGSVRRYRLSGTTTGAVDAVLETPRGFQSEPGIEGAWVWADHGYAVELRAPLALLGDRVRVGVVDADETGRGARPLEVEVATVLAPDTEIDLIVKGLARANARITVLDSAHRVLAQAGSLGPPPAPREAGAGSDSMWSVVTSGLARSLSALIFPRAPAPPGTAGDADALSGREVESAYSGIAAAGRRALGGGDLAVALAAEPVWQEDRVMGVVLVEETTEAILAVRTQALSRLTVITLAVFGVTALALMLFAGRISSRVRRLRDDADAAIDAQGRVRGRIRGSEEGDEIGDLRRSFASLIDRLRQYTGYLEQMAGRMSHELRTPIAVVRSSLDNLKGQALPAQAQVYVERADRGVARLSTILTRMSEATRLEQALAQAERERFDLAEVVAGCVEGYRAAYPQRNFVLKSAGGALPVRGVPDLVAQLLDKLAGNAADFAAAGTPITVRLDRDGGTAVLRVLNEGPRLPADMEGRLFESMVSVRGGADSNEPHLGLGLYIVRLIAEFHGGTAALANREDVDGVVATVRLPLAADEPRS